MTNAFRWSFGGNRLQIRAEAQLLLDVETVLGTIAPIGFKDSRTLQSLATKQDLLIGLLDDEHNRLHVWLHPLENKPRRIFPSSHTHAAGEFVSLPIYYKSHTENRSQYLPPCSEQLG